MGQKLLYTITVSNNGPNPAADVVVTDQLPNEVEFVSVESTQGTCTNAAGTILCTLGQIPKGSNAVVTLVTRPVRVGTVVNEVSAEGSGIDLASFNNTSSAINTVVADANLTLFGTSTPDKILLGSPLNYSFIVTNRGPNPAHDVRFLDTLPASVDLVSADATGGACTIENGVVTCSFGDVPVGSSITATILLNPTQTGAVTNMARVAGAEFEFDVTDNTIISITQVALDADLSLTMTASADPGATGTN